MLGIGDRTGALLAHFTSSISREFCNIALDRVKFAEVFQRLFGDLTFVAGEQLKEFSSRMGNASDLGDPQLESGFVAFMVITDQLAAPITEERSSMFTRTTIGELIDDGTHVGELRGGIRPYVCALRLSFAWNQHLHRCLIGVQHTVL
ncbi:hypothetical protein NA66_102692 [Burkholderia pyrrocinia]|uniref:Uncharacterized protein n=1 Tax=Burkholderia pyrrocinia TaxID=60550 RepID=A0A318I5D8_BURPY|nr:hypothetical protein NA66_102692 [Burkholderia pyrrocinia]SFY44720.1 hypothetical protein SAMN03159408_05933 [Burkholderia sp. NFPP32]